MIGAASQLARHSSSGGRCQVCQYPGLLTLSAAQRPRRLLDTKSTSSYRFQSSDAPLSQRPGGSIRSWSLRERLRKLTSSVYPVSVDNEAEERPKGKKEGLKNREDSSVHNFSASKARRRAELRRAKRAAERAASMALVTRTQKLRASGKLGRVEIKAKRQQAIERGERIRAAQQQARKDQAHLWQSSVDVITPVNRIWTQDGHQNDTHKQPQQLDHSEGHFVGVEIGKTNIHSLTMTPAGEEQEGWKQIVEKLIETSHNEREKPPHLSLDKETIQTLNQTAHHSPERKQHSTSRHGHGNGTIQGELIKGASIPFHRLVEATQLSAEKKVTSSKEYFPIERIPKAGEKLREWWDKEGKWTCSVGGKLSATEIEIQPIEPLRPMEAPLLAHGLDRVLFNPGVHWLRDVRSGIYNFDPKLRDLYDVDLFDYSALPPYLTSSIDPELAELVRKTTRKYSGSTSSMTALLSHIYFLISAWRQPDLTGYSAGFTHMPKSFSYGAKLPASIILRRFEDDVNGEKHVRYAIDADKSSEGSANSNYVLMQLGKSVEKLLTSKPEEYERYLRVNSHTLTQEERERKEAYHYAASDKIVMRSQLDCRDDRLPRKTFDLKTRAVIAVRQDRANWVESSGYKIRHATGVFESFEREMWDMTRAALLKYYFQARIGHMDGILVAYHSTATMYGFQYLPLEDMAVKLFGGVEMGEQAFRLTVGMLERILDSITDIKPDHSLKITLDTESGDNPTMLVFAQALDDEDGTSPEPIQEEESFQEEQSEEDDIPASSEENEEVKAEESAEDGSSHRAFKLLQLDVRVDRYLGEELVKGPVDFTLPNGYRINETNEDEVSRRKRANLPSLEWSVEYSVRPRSDLSAVAMHENLKKVRGRKEGLAPLILPNVEAINEREKMREEELSKNEAALLKFYEDRNSGVALGMPAAPGQASSDGQDIYKVAASDGDANAASADLKEEEEKTTPTQRWKKKTHAIERLRELARLGKEDTEREAKLDPRELYERRGD